MSATGLDVFDRTLQETNIWLKEIMEDLGPDRQVAYRALRAALHALRDRLTTDEAAHLAAQLPMLVRGIFYEQWDPQLQPPRVRSQAEFLEIIAASLGDIRPINPDVAARAVFGALDRHLGGSGEIEQVRQSLPIQIRSLWPDHGASA
jgi:uncharacterized protein (DUF2267 family)